MALSMQFYLNALGMISIPYAAFTHGSNYKLSQYWPHIPLGTFRTGYGGFGDFPKLAMVALVPLAMSLWQWWPWGFPRTGHGGLGDFPVLAHVA